MSINEDEKVFLNSETPEQKESKKSILLNVFSVVMKILDILVLLISLPLCLLSTRKKKFSLFGLLMSLLLLPLILFGSFFSSVLKGTTRSKRSRKR